MKSHRCCHAPATREVSPASSPLRRIRTAAEWVVPGAVLVAMPKCPACVAAYIALGTGLGISFSAAEHLRILVLTLCLTTLAVLAIRRVRAWRRRR